MPLSPSSMSNESFASSFSSQQTAPAAAAEPAHPMPRRPRTAYIFFTQAHRTRIKKELEAKKGHKLSEGPKVMGKSGKVCVVLGLIGHLGYRCVCVHAFRTSRPRPRLRPCRIALIDRPTNQSIGPHDTIITPTYPPTDSRIPNYRT